MKKYDIVVIGGGTAGCAAAYISGKLGLKTLLIERAMHLGGTITSGLVVPVMKSGENQINTNFYNDLILELKNVGGQITYQENPGWFNPELTKIVLDKMMKDANVDVLLNTQVLSTKISSNLVDSIEINTQILSPYICALHSDNMLNRNNKILSEYIEAKYYIDTTGNCEFSKLINCEFLDNDHEFQPMSLRFCMGGINLEYFAKWLSSVDSDRNVTSVEVINGVTHLSTAYTWDSEKQWALAPFFEDAVQKGILKDTDRNYFQVFTVAGMPDTLAFNCPRVVENLDPNSTEDISYALISARESILRLSNFCKIYFPGFEKAYISNIADSIGVRVSNRIRGKYVYTIEDLKSGKTIRYPSSNFKLSG